jgi:hypothetical protein
VLIRAFFTWALLPRGAFLPCKSFTRFAPANGRPARTACARQCFLGFPRESHREPRARHLRKQTSPRAPKTDPGAVVVRQDAVGQLLIGPSQTLWPPARSPVPTPAEGTKSHRQRVARRALRPFRYLRILPQDRERVHLVHERVKCGKPSCRCARGLRHGPYTFLRYRYWDRDAGRDRYAREYVPRSELPRVRRWIRRARAETALGWGQAGFLRRLTASV